MSVGISCPFIQPNLPDDLIEPAGEAHVIYIGNTLLYCPDLIIRKLFQALSILPEILRCKKTHQRKPDDISTHIFPVVIKLTALIPFFLQLLFAVIDPYVMTIFGRCIVCASCL